MKQECIAVIGSGPAGLSAAVTAAVRRKKVLLFGRQELSVKLKNAPEIRNYLGFPSVDGQTLLKRFRRHLEELELSVKTARVNGVYPQSEGFILDTADGEHHADAVILATGIAVEHPLPGEKELLGRGVSYCATCDAFFYRGKTVAVIGSSPYAAEEALFLAEAAAKVLYFPVRPHAFPIHERIVPVNEIPIAVSDGEIGRGVQTDHAFYPTDGIFILHETVRPELLLPDVRTDGAHIAVDAQMRTSVAGCFACGDMTGTPYQLPKAVGQGNTAALSAVRYLAERRAAKG